MGQVQNPNWPRISDVIDFYDSRGTPIANCLTWVDVTKRGRGSMTTVVGRNYETDAQRAGELKQTLDNFDSAFDPTNTGSPFYPLVKLRRSIRRLAQYPVNANLLTPDQATAGSFSAAASGTTMNALAPAAGAGSSLTDTSGFLAVSTGAAVNSVTLRTVTDGPNSQCPNVYEVTLQAGEQGKSAPKMWLPVIPGQPYALQLQARCTTWGACLPVQPQLFWCNSGGPDSGTALSGSTAYLPGPGLLTANPYFLTDVSNWSPTGGTAARSTAVVYPGQVASMLLTPNGISSQCFAESNKVPVVAGQQYKANAWLYSPVGHTAGMSINWFDSSHNYISTTSGGALSIGTNTWTFVSTTGTAPAGAAYGDAIPVQGSTPPATALLYVSQAGLFDPSVTSAPWQQITLSGTAPSGGVFGMKVVLIAAPSVALASAMTVQSSAWQVEESLTNSAWVLPGQVYSLITAYNERWPQDYGDAGTYGLTAVTASDFLAFLNQGQLLDAIGSTVMEYAPSFYYRLDDQQGSTAAIDAAGLRQAAPLLSAPSAGSVTFGTTVTATTPSLVPQGTDGSCAHFANTNTAITGVDLTGGGLYPAGPGNGGASNNWSRAITFRCTAAPTHQSVIWGALASSVRGSALFSLYIDTSGRLNTNITIDGLSFLNYFGSADICDGNWHTILVSANTNTVATSTLYVDDVAVATAVLGGIGGLTGFFATDFIGGQYSAPNGLYQQGFTGDIAHVAEWPVTISPSNGWGLYKALVSAYSGDSASGRWARLLRMASHNATYRASSSVTSSVAPMTDTGGASPFTAMDRQVVTENGDHFISGWGIPTFRARLDRYNTTPVAVFGENSALGELPYENPVGFDYDDARIASQVQVTQQPAGSLFTATDTRSPLPYGPALMTRDNYAISGAEVQASATYLLARYQDPHLRLRSISVHPGANPALWSACLGLTIGSRVRVQRRPIGANPITFDGFVEKLSWSFLPGDATLVIQMSPADTQTYWMLSGPNAPGTTTLAGSSLVGATSLSVNGMPAATAANAGFVQGQPIIVGSGTANAELATITGPASTVIVSVFGGQVVFSTTIPVTALTKTHSSGDTIAIAGAVPGGGGSLAAYSVLDSTTRLAY